MRIEVEAKKLGAKEKIADIEAWNSGINAQLAKRIAKWIKCGHGSTTAKEKHKQLSSKKNLSFTKRR